MLGQYCMFLLLNFKGNRVSLMSSQVKMIVNCACMVFVYL